MAFGTPKYPCDFTALIGLEILPVLWHTRLYHHISMLLIIFMTVEFMNCSLIVPIWLPIGVHIGLPIGCPIRWYAFPRPLGQGCCGSAPCARMAWYTLRNSFCRMCCVQHSVSVRHSLRCIASLVFWEVFLLLQWTLVHSQWPNYQTNKYMHAHDILAHGCKTGNPPSSWILLHELQHKLNVWAGPSLVNCHTYSTVAHSWMLGSRRLVCWA